MLSCSKCNIIEVRYHSNSKEYTLHISADGGAIFFTKSKNTMKKHLLKFFNYDLKDEEIKYITLAEKMIDCGMFDINQNKKDG